jgi:hypothetical protein
VLGDALFTEEKLPSFIQAFDALNNPQVTAQATIRGPELDVPDKVYFADWGSLADGAWDFEYNPGEEFLRKGEFELDSAMALYWQPTTIEAGETKEYVTHYGLGGITRVPGLLSLGVTSPAEIVMDTRDKTAQIVAYVQNTAEINAEDVKVSLDLPSGLDLASDTKIRELGNLEPQETAQVMWEVRPTQLHNQTLNYEVKVTAGNTDDNQVSRSLSVVGPPKLSLELMAPANLEVEDNQLREEKFTVRGRITNNGNSTAYGLEASIALSPGLKIRRGDKEEKTLGSLQPGESIEVPWHVEPVGITDGSLPYAVQVRSENTRGRSKGQSIVIPPRQPLGKISIKQPDREFKTGDYLTARVVIENISEFYQLEGSVNYNNQVLKPVYISRGKLFVKNDNLLSWNSPTINHRQGVIENLAGTFDIPENVKEGIVASIHFRVIDTGEVGLKFRNLKIDRRNSPNLFTLQLEGNNKSVGGE